MSNQLEIPLVRTLSAGENLGQVPKPSPKDGGPKFVSMAICLDDSGDADLIRGKTYRIINDRRAAADGYLRIVDESGGDYLYSNDRFLVVKKRVTSRIADKLFS
jgi:hypothetical protein